MTQSTTKLKCMWDFINQKVSIVIATEFNSLRNCYCI